ncbi:hypothetical protein N7490_005355 [Penicillium lividum]|nr:hypothetical protein N7490_005355 [Penicillium lividum]
MTSCKEHMMETSGPPDINCRSARHVVGVRRGIQLNFTLLEPVVYLQANSLSGGSCNNKPVILRGYLNLKVTEPTKIKKICAGFYGRAQVQLLGESVFKQDLFTSDITYFDHGNTPLLDSVPRSNCYCFTGKPLTASESGHNMESSVHAWGNDPFPPPEYYTYRFHQSQLPVARKEGPRQIIQRHLRGHYGLFDAGDYLYPFEFVVHDSLPETINTNLISARYYLEATVESSGLFHSKIRSQVDIPFLRLPSENSLELIEPILSSKDWRDQLHYDICILGKSFPFGSRIPIRLKLTPLVNLEFRWIKVYVSQHVKYWRTDREPHQLQLPTLKVLLFQEQAGISGYSTYTGSQMRVTSDQGMVKPARIQTPNLLGQILKTSEIELAVQLPRCPEMKVKEKWQQLKTSTRGGKPDMSHSIKIALSFSNSDEIKTATSNPKPMELIIESPITILSCKATPANIYVPPYTAEPDRAAVSSRNCQCDCVGSATQNALASVCTSEVPETEMSTSFKPKLPDDITRPLSFDSSSTDMKPPDKIHLPNWDCSS